MAPAPISWPPSQSWDGDDGSWSSFALRIGSPQQTVRVLPSTTGQQTWVVSTEGCPVGSPGTAASPSCDDSRGGLFDTTQSSSWQGLGNYSLGLELNLGYDETAPFGLDTVGLGFYNSTGGPTIDSQVIASLATDDYYIGVFGLSPNATTFDNYTHPRSSFLTAMHNRSLIPSLSWAYTAGAPYRSKGVFGSLTFGGYDRSRFIPNNVPFYLAPDNSRDLVVGLQSIHSTVTDDSDTQQLLLLPKPILTFIDSTIPYIYLPIEACQTFEKNLGLVWNSTTGLYEVNETLHQSLLSKNLEFTFTIGDTIAGGPTVQIVLPYASFDLEISLQPSTTRYFPLQQAVNDSQYTLGRTFLQEAYIIVDYERSNFSISQCLFEDGSSEDLVAIPSATEISNHHRRNVAIGTSIGTASFLLFAALAAFFAIRRWRQKTTTQGNSEATQSHTPFREPRASMLSSAQEIDHNSMAGNVRELPDNTTARVELASEQAPLAPDDEIFEMSEAPPPIPHESKPGQGSQVMVQERTADTWKILFPTSMPRRSWTSVASSDGAPCVETVISASAQRKELNMDEVSIITSNLEAEILSLYVRTPLDLNRSLSPTPISESPQVSPALEGSNIGIYQRPQMLKILPSGSDSPLCLRIGVSTCTATSSKDNRLSVSGFLTSVENPNFEHHGGMACGKGKF